MRTLAVLVVALAVLAPTPPRAAPAGAHAQATTGKPVPHGSRAKKPAASKQDEADKKGEQAKPGSPEAPPSDKKNAPPAAAKPCEEVKPCPAD